MLILVRQKDLEDEKLFTSIEKENPTIKQDVKTFIDNNGMVFGRKKSGEIRCLSFFERNKENDKEMKHAKNVFLSSVDENEKTQFLAGVEDQMREDVSFAELEKVEWDDKEIETKKIKVGKLEVGIGIALMLAGIIAFILTDEILWLLIGIVLGTSSGYLVSSVEKKK